MGIFISESGSESSLKSEEDKTGFPGFILLEQDARKIIEIAKTKSPLPFMFFIDAIKVKKERKRNCEELRSKLPEKFLQFIASPLS
jgi:hypothetical protein